MSSVNLVVLVGNLAADPEIKNTSQGSKIARMRLITSDTYKDRDGNRKENAHGHNIVVFNERLVDVIESYARKGQKIAIQGKLENRSWTDADDVKKYATEVVLPRYGGEFRMLSSSGENSSGESGEARGGNRSDTKGAESGGGNRDRAESPRDDRRDNASDDRGSNQRQSDNQSRASDDSLDDDVPF